ncbi:uncharacterized protein LOC112452403 [Temnothorax curvispinosus]|uniref:Uncharacterized protein LOC112452403 n=1 Tax=Temnothorax curvispinosus TaxID=300111 RepID=A0A6J1PFP7_9HYME|nr:uncharacterized protein LOC112452403 [Temnothorax curvispinosus]
MANGLTRLLPNLGGPGGHVRRLYATTVHSVLLYGAPVWAERVEENPTLCRRLVAVQRHIVNRAARAYRTVSHVGVTVLAGILPIDLLAISQARTYRRLKELEAKIGLILPRARATLKLQKREILLQEWEDKLSDPRLVSGRRIREAVQPVLRDWIAKKGRGLTFHVAQVLSGHGSFGEYLCRIGRERTTGCHHCPEQVNSAQHTLVLPGVERGAPSPPGGDWG